VHIVGALERLEVILIPANQICRHCQQFEILSTQRCFLVRTQERLVGVGPGPVLIGSTGEIEVAARVGTYSLLPARRLLHAPCFRFHEISGPIVKVSYVDLRSALLKFPREQS
jgi:hypothetical protein